MERALSEDIDPPLTPSSGSGDCCAVLSPESLLQWLVAHCPTGRFHVGEEEEVQGLSSVMATATAGSSAACCGSGTGSDEMPVVESDAKLTVQSVHVRLCETYTNS